MAKNIKKFNLEGLIVNKTIQTESVFKVRLDVTNIKKFTMFEVIEENLRDILTEIDNQWSKLASERNIFQKESFVKEHEKGKNVEGKARVTRNAIEFIVIPQALSNSMKYIRRMVYDAINRYGIKVPLEKFEGGTPTNKRMRYIYFVPKNLYPKLEKEIEEINSFIYELNHVRGKITQVVKEGEEGKYSLDDYFSSPFWNRLKDLIRFVVVVNEVLKYPEVKAGGKELKSRLIEAIGDSSSVEEALAEAGIKSETLRDILRIAYNKANEVINSIPTEISPVKINPLIIDMSYNKIREWVERDPESGEKLKKAAEDMIKNMAKQMASEFKDLLNEIKMKAKSYKEIGSLGRFRDDLNAFNEKLEALGMGRVEVIDDIIARASGEKISSEELMNMLDEAGDYVNEVLDVGELDLGEEDLDVGDEEMEVI